MKISIFSFYYGTQRIIEPGGGGDCLPGRRRAGQLSWAAASGGRVGGGRRYPQGIHRRHGRHEVLAGQAGRGRHAPVPQQPTGKQPEKDNQLNYYFFCWNFFTVNNGTFYLTFCQRGHFVQFINEIWGFIRGLYCILHFLLHMLVHWLLFVLKVSKFVVFSNFVFWVSYWLLFLLFFPWVCWLITVFLILFSKVKVSWFIAVSVKIFFKLADWLRFLEYCYLS